MAALKLVQDCKLSLLSVEYYIILLTFMYIFIQNGWWVELRLKILPFWAQNAFWIISFIPVDAKWVQLVPDFVKTLIGTLRLKTNTFKAPNFNLVLISYHTIFQENKTFRSSSEAVFLVLCDPLMNELWAT